MANPKKKRARKTPNKWVAPSDARRARMRQHKADLIRRGLCRQCAAKRGDSPSKSRCRRCYEEAREGIRKANGSLPWQPGMKGGRKPLDARQTDRKARRRREGAERSSFDVPIDRG